MADTIEAANAAYVPCSECEGDGCHGPDPVHDGCKRCGGSGCEPAAEPSRRAEALGRAIDSAIGAMRLLVVDHGCGKAELDGVVREALDSGAPTDG